MIKKITEKELNDILEKHKLWLSGRPGGACADLSYTDLSDYNLDGAILGRAYLRGAKLTGCNLTQAIFKDAVLENAQLGYTSLCYTSFEGASLNNADFFSCNGVCTFFYKALLNNTSFESSVLYRTNFDYASGFNINFDYTDLIRTSFSRARIPGATFKEASLIKIDLTQTILDKIYLEEADCPLACPDTGSFVAWKKVDIGTVEKPGRGIVKLYIPDDAERCSETGRKCRASKAYVLDIQTMEGESIETIAHSFRGGVYEKNKWIYPDEFDSNRWNECSNGIHFFITRKEAERYPL